MTETARTFVCAYGHGMYKLLQMGIALVVFSVGGTILALWPMLVLQAIYSPVPVTDPAFLETTRAFPVWMWAFVPGWWILAIPGVYAALEAFTEQTKQ